MKEKNLDGSGKPLTEPSAPDFAETLVSSFELKVQEAYRIASSRGLPREIFDTALNKLNHARQDLLQALRVPKGEELTVWDRYAMAAPAMPEQWFKDSPRKKSDPLWHWGEASAAWAAYYANACMAERSRREAQA
jgi:hypothetical protein